MKKSKRSPIKNLLFLIKPFWENGKLYVVLSLIMAVFVTPINSIANVLFTQSVIDSVAAGNDFVSVVLVICKFLVILLTTSIITLIFNNLYAEPVRVRIIQRINYKIYCKSLQTDYQYFDDSDFYNNYTWALNEYAAKSQEAVNIVFKAFSTIANIVSMTTIILVVGPWILLISLIELIITMLFEIKQNKLNIKRQEEIIPIDRRLGYVHRVFYQKEYSADLKTTMVSNDLFGLYSNNSNSKETITRKYSKKQFGLVSTQNSIAVLYNALLMGYISFETIVTKKLSVLESL